MVIIGLDLSLTASGMVALGVCGGIISAKTFGYGLKRTSSTERKLKRLLHIASEVCTFVQEVLSDPSISLDDISVVIEGYAYSARGSQNDLAELQGAVKTQLYLMFKIVSEPIPSTRARKLVLGRGRVTKDQILEELAQKGHVFTDHNQADAFVVAYAKRLMLEQS